MRCIKNCTILGYYAASSGNLLPTFRDNLSIQSSGFKNWIEFLNPEDGTDRLSRNVGKKSPLLAANNSEERSSQLLRSGILKSRMHCIATYTTGVH